VKVQCADATDESIIQLDGLAYRQHFACAEGCHELPLLAVQQVLSCLPAAKNERCLEAHSPDLERGHRAMFSAELEQAAKALPLFAAGFTSWDFL
jgi:hypothetical protein